jgi:glycosyltransferase involved in cell wall biosynthesis
MKKLKLLFVNNYFYLRGGSERVFFEEAYLLEKNGNSVVFLSTDDSSFDIKKFNVILIPKIIYSIKNIPAYIFSRLSRKAIKEQIINESPDIIHAHNIYGAITPSVLLEAHMQGVPTVLTLHDYKLLCPTYLLMRNGRVCEECKGGKFYRAAVNKCKGGSLLSSLVVMLEAYVHKVFGLWKKNVTAYIAPSNFMKNKMIDFGWNPDLIYVVPNFLPLNNYRPEYKVGDYLLYMGRLSEEKGISTLIDAVEALKSDEKILIAGSGPLEKELKASLKPNSKIVFLGYISGNELESVVKNSMGLIVPSVCYENASMAILEAMAYGKPVIGARIGGIPEMISHGKTGFLFEPGNAEDLRSILNKFFDMTESDIESMGRAARKHVESMNSSESHYGYLMTVYDSVIK